MSETDLARRGTIRELVAAFQAAEAEVRACYARLIEAEDALNKAYMLGSSDRIRIDASHSGYQDNYGRSDDTIERMARGAWSYIVDRLEAKRTMSVERYNKMQHALQKEKLPPITEENVVAFVESYMGEMREMWNEAVCEVFDWLRPRRSKLKTNSELEVGKRVILPHVVESAWFSKKKRVVHHYAQNLLALENVFHGLDGKGHVSKTWQSELQMAIESSDEGSGETDLFRFRSCKNRNLHLEFKRLDLLQRFNQIAGGRRLRPVQDNAA